jgi:hypothetical protein
MYGVDQCRVCGTAIRPHGRRTAEFQEKANRKPPIPEEEWRRRGYLCAPTLRQLTRDPSNGCCAACGRKEMRKFFMVRSRLVIAVAVLVLTITFAIFLDSYMHH